MADIDSAERRASRHTVVSPWALGLIGVAIGVAATLLAPKLWQAGEDPPRQLLAALHCPDLIPSTAAAPHRIDGYSWFAIAQATTIVYTGCETGPGATYLGYRDEMPMSHVVATLHRIGAVCVVGQGLFNGQLLDGRAQLEELCEQVGGRLEVLEGHP